MPAPFKKELAIAIGALERLGWTLIDKISEIRNGGYRMRSPQGDVQRLHFRGRHFDKKNTHRYLIGIYHNYFKLTDLVIIYAEGEKVLLALPSSFLVGIFDPAVSTIKKNRWHVHVVFSDGVKSSLSPDKYPGKPSYDISSFELPWVPLEERLDNTAGRTWTENEIRLALRKHRSRDRDLRKQKIEQALLEGAGRLVCEVPGCGHDFVKIYGKIGYKFAHVHHKVALASSDAPLQNSIADLSVVCPNCHAMIHRWMRLHPNDICPIDNLIVSR